MKKLVLLFASLFIIAITAQNVNAQVNPTASSTATASANIIRVLSISNSQGLLFGNIIASAAGGTVTISETGTASYEGVAAPTGNEGDRQEAQFTVKGENKETYSLTLPTSVMLNNEATSQSMELTEFKTNAEKVLTDGQEIFGVGATLTVNANQPAGQYTGKFDVIVAYN